MYITMQITLIALCSSFLITDSTDRRGIVLRQLVYEISKFLCKKTKTTSYQWGVGVYNSIGVSVTTFLRFFLSLPIADI